MRKTTVSLAAVACVTLVAALAAPRAGMPAYQYGLSGNAWWASLGRKETSTTQAASTPAAAPAFQYGLTGNEWWAAQGRRIARRAD